MMIKGDMANNKITSCILCKRSLYALEEKERETFFPFCSSVCQKKDLGNWVFESYRIPVPGSSDSSEPSIEESES
jgi:endogenous inhibitor of DNA gyrase (YacG/DUF329 family)